MLHDNRLGKSKKSRSAKEVQPLAIPSGIPSKIENPGPKSRKRGKKQAPTQKKSKEAPRESLSESESANEQSKKQKITMSTFSVKPQTKKDSKAEEVEVEIRSMDIDDLFVVWKLGERLYDKTHWPNLYRTWDAYCVTELFNTDSEFCLVGEADDEVMGFAMGTTIKKASWKYGYLEWLGVAPEYQRLGVARKLYDKFLEIMLAHGVKILLVDTQADNIPALRFFEKIGFHNPQPCVYLSRNLNEPPTSHLMEITETLGLENTSSGVPTTRPKTRRKTKSNDETIASKVLIRDMTLEDVAHVYHLGGKIFTATKSQSHYRSWDQFTVVEFFNGDPEYCIVAEYEKKIVGFCLGTTIQKSGETWKHGYITWIGVKDGFRRKTVGTMLYNEMVKRMQDSGVRLLLVDTEAENLPAISFFAKHYFSSPKKHIYLDLNLTTVSNGTKY